MSNVIPLRSRDEVQQPLPPQLPDSLIRTTALKAYEVVQGVRTVEQLSKYVSNHVIASLQLQRALHTERDTLFAKQNRVVPMPGRVTSSEITPYKVFGVVVMHSGHSSRSVSMCFEHFYMGWRATEISII